ncbi:hypothetical protein [Sphingobacterium sp.]|uniref:hypothetical protein n=1 Tax=Sphingobacterium sp. TaxID=341027 RepID=UPI0028A67BCA|nr:hypothetical protein [Sphingobacterium sp.]
MSFTAIIDAQIDDFVRNLNRAQSVMDDFSQGIGREIADIGKSFQAIGGAISIGITAPITAAAGAAYNMAADFEDALGAVDQVLKQASGSTKEWADNLPTYFGIAKKEALEYSSMMSSMLINIGNLTEQEASKQSAKLIELAGDLTAMYGGTTQDAVRALTGALKGNNTMLDNYGMAASDALVKAKALSLGLADQGKELSLAAKQTATLALIYEQSGAAQGQAAREAEGASGTMRAFRTEITNLTTELGSNLLPIVTPIISRLKDMVAGLRSLSPETQKLVVVIGLAVAALGPFLVALGSLMQLAPLVGAAFAALTGPIGLTVAAVGLAVAGIIKYWDEIKAYFTSGQGAKFWDSIKNAADSLWQSLKSIFESIKTFVIAVWDRIGYSVVKSVGAAFGTILNTVDTVITLITNILNTLAALLRGDWSGVLNGFKNLFVDAFKGIVNIVVSATQTIYSALASLSKFVGLDSFGGWLQGLSDDLDSFKTTSKDTTVSGNEVAVAISKIGKSASDTKSPISGLSDAAKKMAEQIANLKLQLEGTLMSEWGRQLFDINNKYDAIIKKYGSNKDILGLAEQARNAELLRAKMGQILEEWQPAKLNTDGVNPSMQFTIPNIQTGQLDKSLSDVKAKVSRTMEDIGLEMSAAIENILSTETAATAISDFASSLGGALATGGNVISAMGKSLLGSIGGIMVQLGKMAIKTGLGLEAVKRALESLNPYVAIAAGVALVAIGSAFSSGAKNLGGSMGSGGYSGGYSANTSSSYDYSQFRGALYNNDRQTMTVKIQGPDLVGSIDINNNRNNRLS